ARVVNYVDESSGDVNIKSGDFKTIYTSNQGGEFTPYDPADYPVFKYEFEYPLTKEEYEIIAAQPNYAISFNTDGVTNTKAFIQELKYSRRTGIGQFTLFRAKNT